MSERTPQVAMLVIIRANESHFMLIPRWIMNPSSYPRPLLNFCIRSYQCTDAVIIPAQRKLRAKVEKLQQWKQSSEGPKLPNRALPRKRREHWDVRTPSQVGWPRVTEGEFFHWVGDQGENLWSPFQLGLWIPHSSSLHKILQSTLLALS